MESTTSGLSFLSLPPEIRNEIYSYLFHDAKLGVSTIHSVGPLCGSFCSCAFPWAISNTCRLLRHETIPLLLRQTTLEVTNRIEKTALLPDHFLNSIPRAVVLDAKVMTSVSSMAFLLAAGSKSTPMTGKAGSGFQIEKFRSLRVLELRNISVWCKYHEETYLESQEADECMFNLAMFNLGRISPALTSLCNNATRGFKVLLGCQFVGSSMTHETIQAVIDVDSRTVLQKAKGASIRSRNEWAGFY